MGLRTKTTVNNYMVDVVRDCHFENKVYEHRFRNYFVPLHQKRKQSGL